ncbi:MAG: FAD-binding and (Fe-S)-binding domain-containing protein [Angustibacter sp.]
MRELTEALRAAGVGAVDDSQLRRSLYASDASLYRVPPLAVVTPREVDEVLATLAVCRERGVPLTMRGAGTSVAGNAVGVGVVVDVSRHLNRVLDVDTEAGTALVEPGVVLADLQRALAPSGWRFGPDPSTHDRCTLGGMIGNNACGSRSLGYGRTSDNVLGLDVVTGAGERLALGHGATDRGEANHERSDHGRSDQQPADTLRRLRELIGEHLMLVRTSFGRFGRQASGYALEHLLPERGFDVARALAGSEGTLALTLAAQLRLVRDAPVRRLVVLGYPSMVAAADAVPALLPHRLVACEGLDRRIVQAVIARRGTSAVPTLPQGDGWLFAELTGSSADQVEAAAQALVRDAGAVDSRAVTDPGDAAALWRIRADGAGLAGRTPDGAPAHPGWEDSAVPPERLGAYLRGFEALLTEHRLTGLPYGHFGDGCLHVRLDFPLGLPDGTARMRAFLLDAARLAAEHGGSMSGEHGDGRARGELLPLMYPSAAIRLFEQVKAIFDPDDVLNPGVLVRPAALDADVRAAAAPPYRRDRDRPVALAYRHDRGDLSMAVHRCTGVGKCRADTSPSGGVMCPSYLATRDERDSTRGRARVLQDAVAGHLGPDGWRSSAVHDALDLCLSCKGCASDCPAGVDMASYKAEVLHQRYRGRVRPRAHYALGWLPWWARLVGRLRLAPVANAALAAGPLHPLLTWAAGVDRRRTLPRFAERTFRQWFTAQPPSAGSRSTAGPPSTQPTSRDVVLFADTFTDAFSPQVGRAAVAVLQGAGYRVRLTRRAVCCGLTWISTGQLDGARRRITATVRELEPLVRNGSLVVGLEPSCTAVLRGDAAELVAEADRPAADAVAGATRTLAELLTQTPGWSPPDLSEVQAVAQPHCHQHAVMGWDADAALLRRAGADVRPVGGCCGLAGNFGVERGHHDVSVAVAEHQLLPAVRALPPDATILADGFSCRTQLDDLARTRSEHLAELLARHLRIVLSDPDKPEKTR